MVFTGIRFAHALSADSNAGELVEPLKEYPPAGLGSGKFVTPWERMQRE
jgi:hypothetical protein